MILLGVNLIINRNDFNSQQTDVDVGTGPSYLRTKATPINITFLDAQLNQSFLLYLDVSQRRRIMSNPIAVLVSEDDLATAMSGWYKRARDRS